MFGLNQLTSLTHWKRAGLALVAAVGVIAAPVAAQVETFDPNEVYTGASQAATNAATNTATSVANDAAAAAATASDEIDADLTMPRLLTVPSTSAPAPAQAPAQAGVPTPVDQWEAPSDLPTAPENPSSQNAQAGFEDEFSNYSGNASANGAPPNDWALNAADEAAANPGGLPANPDAPVTPANYNTYGEDDLIGAAEGVFGKGAKGLAKLIEDLLRDQGEPNGYIVGREAGGAFIVGARYGSGTLHHKIEGQRKVYWTGPSIGFDAGANAGNSFVLVYNLYDTEDIFKRFPGGEGQAYLVGGMHVSYVRRGDIVLIPIRVGAGLRLGVNAGYMKFSKKHRWLPF